MMNSVSSHKKSVSRKPTSSSRGVSSAFEPKTAKKHQEKVFQKVSSKHITGASPKKEMAKVVSKKVKRSMKKGLKVVLLSPVFHTVFRVGVTLIVVSALLYTSYSYISKSFANEVVVSQSEIITRIGLLTELPAEAPDQIVRVQDESALRHQNPFYQDVKEGDYIVMYKHLAIIYDFRNDVIVALKRTK